MSVQEAFDKWKDNLKYSDEAIRFAVKNDMKTSQTKSFYEGYKAREQEERELIKHNLYVYSLHFHLDSVNKPYMFVIDSDRELDIIKDYLLLITFIKTKTDVGFSQIILDDLVLRYKTPIPPKEIKDNLYVYSLYFHVFNPAYTFKKQICSSKELSIIDNSDELRYYITHKIMEVREGLIGLDKLVLEEVLSDYPILLNKKDDYIYTYEVSFEYTDGSHIYEGETTIKSRTSLNLKDNYDFIKMLVRENKSMNAPLAIKALVLINKEKDI